MVGDNEMASTQAQKIRWRKFSEEKPPLKEEVLGAWLETNEDYSCEASGLYKRIHIATGWYMKCTCRKKEAICRRAYNGYHFCTMGKVYETAPYWMPLKELELLLPEDISQISIKDAAHVR